jgi:hypothetical protein
MIEHLLHFMYLSDYGETEHVHTVHAQCAFDDQSRYQSDRSTPTHASVSSSSCYHSLVLAHPCVHPSA